MVRGRLTAIAERVKLADAQVVETALVSMINDNEIHATIDQLTGTVCFHDDDEQYDTEATMQKLKGEVRLGRGLTLTASIVLFPFEPPYFPSAVRCLSRSVHIYAVC